MNEQHYPSFDCGSERIVIRSEGTVLGRRYFVCDGTVELGPYRTYPTALAAARRHQTERLRARLENVQ